MLNPHHQTVHRHFNAFICIASLSLLGKQRGVRDIKLGELLAREAFGTVKELCLGQSVRTGLVPMSLKQKCCLQGHYKIDPMLAFTPQQNISEDVKRFLQVGRSSWILQNAKL